MGAVWTLNANAAETPASAALVAPVGDAAVAPVAEEPLAVPPALLPWGAKPKKIKRAKAGASSAAVAAAGAGAAPAANSGSTVPTRNFAPKGFNAGEGTVETTKTTVVPPAPPAGTPRAKAAPEEKPVVFHYSEGSQFGETDGTWANLTIEKPTLVGDYHSLAELAVRSADLKQTVEVGWHVDPDVYPEKDGEKDVDTHLFVYHWVDGVKTCYNTCDFTSISDVKPGATLPAREDPEAKDAKEVIRRFGIVHSGNAWWIAYDTEWIGFFPDKNWGGRFTKGELTQWFGEVASPSLNPCSEMGNGLPVSKGKAARIGSITMVNGPTVKFDPLARSPHYTIRRMADDTFRFGGAGAPKATEENPNNPC